MKNNFDNSTFDNNIDCFGCFDISDKLCREKCILSIKCAIEQDYNNSNQDEFIDGLLFSNKIFETIQ